MTVAADELEFRFQYVDAAGNAKGLRAQLGCLSPTGIELKGLVVPFTAVLETVARDNRLVLAVDGAQIPQELYKHLIDAKLLILESTKVKPAVLKPRIDRVTSVYRAERHRQELEAEGKAHEFVCVTCPECDATIDASGPYDTAHVYCPYCDSVSQNTGALVSSGKHYRLCEECGWFDRVQGYTEFYFYFLLVVAGYSSKRRFLCDSCVNRVFWKTLLLNFLFIIGIPSSIWMKIKSKKGRVEGFQELAQANALAKKGRGSEAAQLYAAALDRYPGHPGILYDQGFAALAANDLASARSYFQQALQQCSNFEPAQRLLEGLDQVEAQQAIGASTPPDLPQAQ